MQQILEIVKYILPAIIVLIATYVIVNKFLINETERKRLALFHENNKQNNLLRFQAYERLAIFIERIHPTTLIARYYQKDMSSQDLQIAIVQGMRNEFEHNLSQQIYVSHEVWQTVRKVMEQEIGMINSIGSTIEFGKPAKELINKISDFVLNSETVLPTEIALSVINEEAKKTLFIGT